MNDCANVTAVLVEQLRQEALRHVYDIEQLAVEGIGLPFKIPRRYNRYVKEFAAQQCMFFFFWNCWRTSNVCLYRNTLREAFRAL